MKLLDLDFNIIPLWLIIMALILFIILLAVALITGREVSMWQIKIGGRSDNNKFSKPKATASFDKEKFENILTISVVAFFKSYDGYGSPAQIIGEAKGIINRFSSEMQNATNNIQNEIQFKKDHDNNWTYANLLRDGLLLVNYIGLTYQTKEKNQIFLEMTMPQIQIEKKYENT